VNGFSSAIAGMGNAIGRYFSVVSFIPSFLLVGFTFALIKSGAWSGDGAPDWVRAGDSFAQVGDLATLVLISVTLGVVVHPIQFALVQFFEGYWGAGKLAQWVRLTRILHHRRRFDHFRYSQGGQAEITLLKEAAGEISLDEEGRIKLVSRRDENYRLARNYPAADHEEEIMPTRLGNVLRRYERLAGYQYKLDAVQVVRHVAFVAPKEHVDYLNDQRELLDLSVRMCATSIIAAFVAIAFLWHHGPWLAIALLPYGIAYISYRGAVVVAHEYGAAVCTLIDLDRFALYDYLRLPRPKNTVSERLMNDTLRNLLDHNPTVSLRYEYDATPDSAAKKENST
jgi:hypothetical protein